MSIGHRASGIIPAGMEVEFHNAVSGDGKPFDLMMSWCDKAQSKAILGGTLTSQADGKTSTNALGSVHEEVRRELLEGDARQVARTFTRDLILPMAIVNRGLDNTRRTPRFVFDLSEPEDIKIYAAALPRLVDVNMEIPVDWAQERLGIPKPEQGQQILRRSPPEQTIDSAPAALRAALRSKTLTPAEQIQSVARAKVEPASNEWINQIRQIAEEVDSLEALRDRLLQVYPDLTLDQYADAMAEALATAHLAGRNEVVEEDPDALR